MSKELLENIISYMAYERGHSAGEEEVEAIKKGMMYDFKPLFDRIEELERERDLHKAKFDAINKDFDALKANNARLREALEQIANGPWPSDIEGPEDQCRFDRAITQQALAATPKQSLARLRNQVRYECAEVCDRFAEREMHPAECAAAIRAMKEPE